MLLLQPMLLVATASVVICSAAGQYYYNRFPVNENGVIQFDNPPEAIQHGYSSSIIQQGNPTRVIQQGHPSRFIQQGNSVNAIQQGNPSRVSQQGHHPSSPIQQGNPVGVIQQGHPSRPIQQGNPVSVIQQGHPSRVVQLGKPTNAIQQGNPSQPALTCPQVRCHGCEVYVGQDGCLHCGRCPVVRSCPDVECVSQPGLKCYKALLPNGCPTCKCKKTYPACPIPMCSQNCKLVPDRNGCYKCQCYANPTCPVERCPNSCTNYLGPDGCYHCDCGEEVAVCPEVKCDYPRCQPTFHPKTGCATGCQCQSNYAPQNLRTVPR